MRYWLLVFVSLVILGCQCSKTECPPCNCPVIDAGTDVKQEEIWYQNIRYARLFITDENYLLIFEGDTYFYKENGGKVKAEEIIKRAKAILTFKRSFEPVEIKIVKISTAAEEVTYEFEMLSDGLLLSELEEVVIKIEL